MRMLAKPREGSSREAGTAPGTPGSLHEGPGIAQPITLSVLGGLALGLFRLPLDSALQGDNGVAPYGAALLFAAGIFSSTPIFTARSFQFPGQPEDPSVCASYFTRRHPQTTPLLGVLGGMVAAAGFLTGLLALMGPPV